MLAIRGYCILKYGSKIKSELYCSAGFISASKSKLGFVSRRVVIGRLWRYSYALVGGNALAMRLFRRLAPMPFSLSSASFDVYSRTTRAFQPYEHLGPA